MAIAYGNGGTWTANTSPLTPAITLNNGDTGVVYVILDPASLSVASITNGGTWTKRAEVTNGSVKVELWSTDAGAAVAATSLSIAITGTITDAGSAAESYTGVVSLGTTQTASGSGADPSVALTTQDANNWVAAGFGLVTVSAVTAKTGNFRHTDSNAAISVASTDNTAVSASSVTNAVTHIGVAWVAAALELRTTAGGGGGPLPGEDDGLMPYIAQYEPNIVSVF